MTDLHVPIEKMSRWRAGSCERAACDAQYPMRTPDYIAFSVLFVLMMWAVLDCFLG
jgi:hypothetical protein